MPAVEHEAIKGMIGERHAAACRLREFQGLLTAIRKAHGARNDGQVAENRILQLGAQFARRVLQRKDQRLRLLRLRIRSRQPRKCRLTRRDGMVIVEQLRHRRAIGQTHTKSGNAEITVSAVRVLLRQYIEGKGSLILPGRWLRRVGTIQRQKCARVIEMADAASPVAVQQIAPAHELEYVADCVILQVENARFFIKGNHIGTSSPFRSHGNRT